MNEATQAALNKHVKVLTGLANYYDECYGGQDDTAEIVQAIDTTLGLIEEKLGER